MKNIIIFSSLILVSCAQLLNGQQQPVTIKNAKEKIYFTTCSGSVEDWGSCNRKARSTCANGYSEIKRFETAVGGRRELTFQCN